MSQLTQNETSAPQTTATKNVKNKKPQVVATILVNLATFSYGTYVGWPSPAIIQLQSDNPPIGEHPITEQDVSWIGSLLFLGFLCGTPIYSYVSDKFGRKPSALLISVPIIINWLIIILGESVYLIYVARFITGVSIGGVLTIIPIYVGEISEVHIRGSLGTFLSIMGNAGMFFTYVVGSYTTYHDFAIICLATPVLFVVCFMWMPETPIYLLSKGKFKEAKRSLEILRGNSGPHINQELNEMSLLTKEIQGRTSDGIIKDLFLNKGCRKALIIGVVISVVNMFSGVFVILSYNATIFQMSGTDLPPHVCSIIVGAVLLIAPMLSCPLMDRAGRRLLLLTSLTVMTICLTVLGLYFYFLEIGTYLGYVGFIPVVCMGIFLLFQGVGLGPVNMVLFSEIFLPHVRSLSASVSTFAMASTAFLVTRFYNDMSSAIGMCGSFWFFAMCCFLGILFTVIFIPETKNRTVESIHAELNGEDCGVFPVRKQYKLNTISELEG